MYPAANFQIALMGVSVESKSDNNPCAEPHWAKQMHQVSHALNYCESKCPKDGEHSPSVS